MNRSTALFCVFALSMIVSPFAHGYMTTKIAKPDAYEQQRRDGGGVLNSAFQGAPGEKSIHLSDPSQYARYDAEMDRLISLGLTLIDRREFEEARIRLTQELPHYRTVLLLHKGDESDSIEIESTVKYRECALEKSINQSASQASIRSLIEAKRGAGYLKVLDKERKLEALTAVAEFLADLPSKTTTRSRRNHQADFVRKFINVNSLPVHVIWPQPSSANMAIIFLADFVAEAGYPEFFDAILGIPDVAAAFSSSLEKETGVQPSAGGVRVQDFNVARSVYMGEYRTRNLGAECGSTPGALLISMLN